MSLEKKDFFGKEVADAIRQACAELNVPQEQLDIEVVETGSTGIFGLRRKKAHIRAAVKSEAVVVPVEAPKPQPVAGRKEEKKTAADRRSGDVPGDKPSVPVTAAVESPVEDLPEEPVLEEDEAGEASPEALAIVQAELATLLELMKMPSRLETEAHGLSVVCTIHGEHEEALTGQEGKILDSLQYVLRKIVARKTTERLRISIDVGEYRQKRIEELREKALELAAMVKADGRTQIIPALNPSERREVHMVLQEDKEIRSRSVGDGLFKKILIYKPGKGGKNAPPRKKQAPRGKKPRTGGSPAEENES
jgi:spoIIIJ-associated protein